MRQHCGIFSASRSDLYSCHKASAVENGHGLHSCHFFFFFLLFFVTLDSYQQLLKFSRCRQLWWRTVTKNWTQVVWDCDKHCVQTFVLWYCATESVAFFWSFFSTSPPPHMGSIAISSCLCMKMAWTRFYSFVTMTFLLKNQNKKCRKTEKASQVCNAPQEWIHTCHLSHAQPHIICHCHTTDKNS